MRLNLGCGHKRLDGFINVDKVFNPAVDMVADLEVLPWPWQTDSIEAVMLIHVLEHLGRDTKIYLGIVKELHRVCKAGAEIAIFVPHPRHDDFLNDPTHVRAITPESLLLFSKAKNNEAIAAGAANTPLAIQLNVDFELTHVRAFLDPRWPGATEADASRYNNVVKQYGMTLKVIK